MLGAAGGRSARVAGRTHPMRSKQATCVEHEASTIYVSIVTRVRVRVGVCGCVVGVPKVASTTGPRVTRCGLACTPHSLASGFESPSPPPLTQIIRLIEGWRKYHKFRTSVKHRVTRK